MDNDNRRTLISQKQLISADFISVISILNIRREGDEQ